MKHPANQKRDGASKYSAYHSLVAEGGQNAELAARLMALFIPGLRISLRIGLQTLN
jgi:hypothetical protein